MHLLLAFLAGISPTTQPRKKEKVLAQRRRDAEQERESPWFFSAPLRLCARCFLVAAAGRAARLASCAAEQSQFPPRDAQQSQFPAYPV